MATYSEGLHDGKKDFSRRLLARLDKEFRRVSSDPELYSLDKIEMLSTITQIVLEERNGIAKKNLGKHLYAG